MIIVKNVSETAYFSFVRNLPKKISDSPNYSILLQNTVSKKVSVYQVTDMGNELYLQFQLDLKGLEDGEYYCLLFENPEHIPFYGEANNPKDIVIIRYVLNNGDYITNGDFYLVFPNRTLDDLQIKPVYSTLVKIGEYSTVNTTYTKQQSYITYKK